MDPSTSVDYEWHLDNVKVRDGRYGPICSGITHPTSKLLTVEVVEQGRDSQIAQTLISHLEHMQHRTAALEQHPCIVTFLGFQEKAEGLCLLWEWEGGGTLQQCIHTSGAFNPDVVGVYLGRLAIGIEELQRRGYTTALLASSHILLASKLMAKIEPPIIDLTVASYAALPPGALTVPELIPDGPLPKNLPKVDVWLLGIVAAEALSGECLTETSARRIRAQLEEKEGTGFLSAWDLFVPRNVAEKLDTHALDFLRQCFM